MGPEGGAGARGSHRAANADGVVLRESGRCPRNVVALVLARVWTEIEDGPSEEGANDGLLQWSDNMGVDGGVHESVFDGVKVVSEDVIIPCNTHVLCHCGWCLICLSSWQREEMGQLSFRLFVDVSV